MNNKPYELLGSGAGMVLTAVQTQQVFQIISLVLNCLSVFYGSGERSSRRDSTGSLKIKFGLVGGQGNLISLSGETLHMGFRKDVMSSYDPIEGELPYKVNTDYKINTSWLYTLIK